MRQLTAEIVARDGGLHPADKSFVDNPDIERETIDYLNYLDDRTGVMMYRLRGEQEQIDEILDTTRDVQSHDILPAVGAHQVYIHFDVDGIAHQLLQLANSHEVVIDFPIECIGRGFRVTVIGEQPDFISAMNDFPSGVRVELVSLTTYSDDFTGNSLLTSRQREILELAVTEGYYDQPRGITRDEIAEALGLSGSTVSEHLQKAEKKVISDFIG